MRGTFRHWKAGNQYPQGSGIFVPITKSWITLRSFEANSLHKNKPAGITPFAATRREFEDEELPPAGASKQFVTYVRFKCMTYIKTYMDTRDFT
jgi:hypothetical protein